MTLEAWEPAREIERSDEVVRLNIKFYGRF